MKYEVTFADIRVVVDKALRFYNGIEILKYDEPIANSGAFLVQYKDIDEDVFTYTILFDYNEDKSVDVDLVDCDGRGFASITMKVDSLVRLGELLQVTQKMFDDTFSDASIEYNIKSYKEVF